MSAVTRVSTVQRPYVLVFNASGNRYPMTSEEAQRLLDEYPVIRATRNRVVMRGHNTTDPKQSTVLLPATAGDGPAFIIDKWE